MLKVRQRKPEIIQAKITICKLDLKMAHSPVDSQLKNVGNLIFHQLGMPVITFKCPLTDFVSLRCLIVSNYTWEKVFIQVQQEVLIIAQILTCCAAGK